MSIYSGKCDLLDCIDGRPDEYILNSKYYFGYNCDKPLAIKSLKDLIPYWAHIIVMAYYNQEYAVIHLSSKSWVDIEESEILNYYLKELMKIFSRCKRKKIEFNIEDAVNEVFCISNKEVITELATRVQKYGNKASIDGLHLSSYEWYRRKLVNEMICNDLNPEDYGYERF